MPSSTPDSPTLDDLADRLGFTLEECAFNRAGLLSERQRQMLFFRGIGHIVRGIALVVLCVVLAAYLTTVIQHRYQWALFGLLCTLIVIVILLLIRAIYHMVARPSIRTLTGTLRRTGDANHPRILAGNTPLRVSFRRWKRLPATFPGRYIFYVGPGNSLLSLEPIREAEEL